jgi:mannose-6-phosphate isomerase
LAAPIVYPFTFQPILMERVWGGRRLDALYAKGLPPEVPIGESWEISDRPGAASVITNGPLAGRDLRWLMEHHTAALLGSRLARRHTVFPLLIKILDAQDKLSLQVHPPRQLARRLGGDPKTEMWFITHAERGADLYVGLKRGVTRTEFERRIGDGSVARCFQRLRVRAGDAMFLPSGRVHAIGAGNVIFEIQQNSDTTYRVFDWNRVGLDGKPRDLHVAESLASIDFADFEPPLIRRKPAGRAASSTRRIVDNPLFRIEHRRLASRKEARLAGGQAQILGVVKGRLRVTDTDSDTTVQLTPGGFCLLPAALNHVRVTAETGAEFLRAIATG